MESTTMNSSEIRGQIDQLAERFMETYNRGDARGMASFYAKNALLMPPNNDFIEGQPQIESFWQAVMDMGVKTLRLKVLEVEQHDDIAYEVGRASLLGEGDQVIDNAKYMVIWKRENGGWKLFRDIFNSNLKLQ
jgi:uncharacterized protein (TIGR02246 family)